MIKDNFMVVFTRAHRFNRKGIAVLLLDKFRQDLTVLNVLFFIILAESPLRPGSPVNVNIQ